MKKVASLLCRLHEKRAEPMGLDNNKNNLPVEKDWANIIEGNIRKKEKHYEKQD